MIGYGGRTLHVDLTRGRSEVRELDERTARAFLGGNGLAARLLWEAVPAGIDAVRPRQRDRRSPWGPITDTLVPGNSRACVATKSPLTGLFFDSTFGGRFPATLKRTGFDAVVVTGRRRHPVYLLVDENGATVRDARSLWGQTTRDTVEADPGGRRRRRRRAGHRPGRRAPRPLRVPRPLLEEPRGRGRSRRASAPSGGRST